MRIMCLVADRKKLVAAIEEATGVKLKYQGPPSFAFAAGDFTVERDGTLCVENEKDNRDSILPDTIIIDYLFKWCRRRDN